MRRGTAKKAGILFLIIFTSATALGDWQRLDRGLDFGIFESIPKSSRGDSLIRVLKIRPSRYRLTLLNASATGEKKSMTAKDWCQSHGLVAAINASMYQKDHLTSVSYMKSEYHVNNTWLSKDKSILAFGRLTSEVPHVRLIDLQCENLRPFKTMYRTFVQSIRMIACDGTNVWEPFEESWSTAVIATDTSGNLMLIHAASPHSTHTLINILKDLPIDIDRAMYAEGGPQAQLYIKSGDFELEQFGLLNSAIGETTYSGYKWPIPNVIGVTPRAK